MAVDFARPLHSFSLGCMYMFRLGVCYVLSILWVTRKGMGN